MYIRTTMISSASNRERTNFIFTACVGEHKTILFHFFNVKFQKNTEQNFLNKYYAFLKKLLWDIITIAGFYLFGKWGKSCLRIKILCIFASQFHKFGDPSNWCIERDAVSTKKILINYLIIKIFITHILPTSAKATSSLS